MAFHPEVDNDSDRVVSYISFDNPIAAARFPVAVRTTAEQVALAPHGYTPHPYYRRWFPQLRHKTVDGFNRYTLYFVLVEATKTVRVMAVLHSARLHQKLLAPRIT